MLPWQRTHTKTWTCLTRLHNYLLGNTSCFCMFYYKAYQSIFDVHFFLSGVLFQSWMVWKWCFTGLKLGGDTVQTFQTNLHHHATITYLWQQLKRVWCSLWWIIKQVWGHDFFVTPQMAVTWSWMYKDSLISWTLTTQRMNLSAPWQTEVLLIIDWMMAPSTATHLEVQDLIEAKVLWFISTLH